MADKNQAQEVQTSADSAQQLLDSLSENPDSLTESDLDQIGETLFGPTEPDPVPEEVVQFEKEHLGSEEAEEEAPTQQEIDYQAEYQKLKEKLGRQGSVQGELRARAERAEEQLRQAQQQPQEPVKAVTGQSFVKELAEQRGIEIPEGLEDVFGAFGDLMLAYTQNLGTSLKPLGDRLQALEGGLAETAAEASLGGGLAPEVKSQVLEENPGLKDIADPAQRIAMMKKLALAEGLIRQEGQAKRTAPTSRRDPARHVSGSGTSSPTKSRSETMNDALARSINSVQNEEDLAKLNPIMDHYFKTVW